MNRRFGSLGLLLLAISLAAAAPTFAHHHHRESRERDSRAERSPRDSGGVLESAAKAEAINESREMRANPVERAFRENQGPASGPVEAGERAARNREVGEQIQRENERRERQRERPDRDNP